MIELKDINMAYGQQVIFQDFSLSIADNEFVAIMGKSGSGKTTLLNIMGLLEKPSSGQVLFSGQEITTPIQRRNFFRHTVGFLFQNFALIEDLDVKDNLLIACKHRPETQKLSLEEALSKVQLTTDALEKKVFQLSGGEQQRVALARLLLKDPEYVLADEPTGNLDFTNRNIVFDLLRKLQQSGKTVIFVTHDAELAKKADRIISIGELFY